MMLLGVCVVSARSLGEIVCDLWRPSLRGSCRFRLEPVNLCCGAIYHRIATGARHFIPSDTPERNIADVLGGW